MKMNEALVKRCVLAAVFGTALGTAEAGGWCYRPYEYEAWMLQKLTDEVGRGVLRVGWPGKFLTLDREPEASFANGRPGEVRKIPLSENGKGD